MYSIREYLKLRNGAFLKIIKNNFVNDKMSHAILLSASYGTPLKDIAKFIIKTHVCSNKIDQLACEKCEQCQKIEEELYFDYLVIDGDNSIIKKDDILKIQKKFSNYSLESINKSFYIINCADNMNIQATNSLLKFLEEPPENVFAYLLTNNEEKILPTIYSRCQIYKINPLNKEHFYAKLLESEINQEYLIVLKEKFEDQNSIETLVSKIEFIALFEELITFFALLQENKKEALARFYLMFTKYTKQHDHFIMFLNVLECFFLLANTDLEIEDSQFKSIECCHTIKKQINNHKNIVYVINICYDLININASKMLLLDKIVIEMWR